MAETTTNGPVLAADGTPLKKSLARALRRQKLRALGLIGPLLIFVLVTFVFPIGDMLLRSIKNDIVADTLPLTVVELADWDPDQSELPGDNVWMGSQLNANNTRDWARASTMRCPGYHRCSAKRGGGSIGLIPMFMLISSRPWMKVGQTPLLGRQ